VADNLKEFLVVDYYKSSKVVDYKVIVAFQVIVLVDFSFI
jgi:hypothetical protein